jgi:thymidylate synthase (FAD)
LEPEFFVPAPDAIREQVGKPGSYTFEPIRDADKAQAVFEAIADHGASSYALYEDLLRMGIAKEQARLVIPVNLYSRMKWKVNLRNLMGFLALRNHPQAMREIRDYASVMEMMVTRQLPCAMGAFIEHGRKKP